MDHSKDEHPVYAGAASPWPPTNGWMTRIDDGLEWITERLDRKFVSAMEKSVTENPDKNQDLNVLKRTVLALVCLGLVLTAISIKFAIDSQMVYFLMG
jgi:hypothetical protein